MDPGLKATLLDLIDLLLKLEVPSHSHVPLDREVLRRWQSALAGDEAGLWADGAKPLRLLLRVLREDKAIISNQLWSRGEEAGIDPDAAGKLELRLTDAAIDCCDRRDWLWLRLKMLRSAQAGAVAAEVFDTLGLDAETVRLARDALILARGLPGQQPQLPADEPELRRAAESLAETLSPERRRRFKEDPNVRAALEAMGIDPDGCLALDAAATYAAQRRAAGDHQAATVADLVSYLLVEPEAAEVVFPEADWDRLREELAGGETRTLARLAEAGRLPRLLVAAVYDPASLPAPLPEAWIAAAVKEHWAPFRDAVLGDGAERVANALSLLAAMHVAAGAKGDLPALARERSGQLGLYEPAGSSGQPRLKQLAESLLALDAEAFRLLVWRKHARELAAEFLASPAQCRALARALGLDENDLHERLFELWKRQRAEAADISREPVEVRTLVELTSAGLLAQRRGSRELLDALGRCGDIPLTDRQLVACCLWEDYDPLRAVSAGGLLRFLLEHRSRPWLQVSPEDAPDWSELGLPPLEVQERIRALADRQRERLLLQLRETHGRAAAEEAANDPDSGLNIARDVLGGQLAEEELLRQRQINLEGLEELKSAFLAGRPEPLTRKFPLPGGRGEDITELAPTPPRARITALRVYLALLAMMAIGYGAIHLWVASRPMRPAVITAPPQEVPVSQSKGLQGLLAELKLAPLNGPDTGGRPIYIRTEPVRYAEFKRLMSMPAGIGAREVGVAVQKPVGFANYEEAQQFCRRQLAYAKARYPELFGEKGFDGGELSGYVCRLPTLAEAQARPLRLEPDSPFDAEWIHTPAAEADLSPLAPKEARLLRPGGAGQAVERRRRADGRTLFRYVLAPAGAE